MLANALSRLAQSAVKVEFVATGMKPLNPGVPLAGSPAPWVGPCVGEGPILLEYARVRRPVRLGGPCGRPVRRPVRKLICLHRGVKLPRMWQGLLRVWQRFAVAAPPLGRGGTKLGARGQASFKACLEDA
jgi:hypothetical protein